LKENGFEVEKKSRAIKREIVMKLFLEEMRTRLKQSYINMDTQTLTCLHIHASLR